MSLTFHDYLSFQCSIQSTCNGTVASGQQPIQLLELRLGHSTHLISRSSRQILQQTPSTPIGDALFPFVLRDLQHPPFLSNCYVLQFLSSFSIPIAACDIIYEEISSFALQLAAGNMDLNFHIVVEVDVNEMIWVDLDPFLVEEYSPAEMNGAPASAIERLQRQKFDGLREEEEEGDCSVCCEALKGEEEVSRIPCGHVYHKFCILKWLQMSNSCPLCRTKLEQ
ncbi:E3 ubiquitin-protein ligase RNF126-like [Cucurbita maxima]|uniref:E3 ubiquitin-protein ligase RNF126-like n=1 Tax=Cucurbita maxima TaxID=3661 RepID=A0A6J1KYV1_CUCMA|nr:E3 ubiquitin-protein ligase RNF126-like [Cucurbita maxima]